MSSLLVKDVMNAHPAALPPETPLLRTVELFVQSGADIPIVTSDEKVVGIITEHELTVQGSVHLPTFLKLLREFRVYSKDQGVMKEYFDKIFRLKAEDAMSKDFLTVNATESVDGVLNMFTERPGLNTIIVLDQFNHLAGILSRRDLIRLLGSPIPGILENKNLDKEIGSMLKGFENEFVMVSGFRTRHWVLLSALFAIIGFIIAFALIVRVRF